MRNLQIHHLTASALKVMCALILFQTIVCSGICEAQGQILSDAELDQISAGILPALAELGQDSSGTLEEDLMGFTFYILSELSSLTQGDATALYKVNSINSTVIVQSNFFFGINTSGNILQINIANLH